MPSPKRSFDAPAAFRHVSEHCFTSTRSEKVGIELEVIPYPTGHPSEHVNFKTLKRATESKGPPPAGASISFEPGGQAELSSLPHAGSASACMATAKDEQVLIQSLVDGGFLVHGTGIDPTIDRPRVIFGPRYDAMEASFDSEGDRGRQMMRNTAALQVNIDLGSEVQGRWELAHHIGPILVAAFANSPISAGKRTAWMSTRTAIWSSLDPSRTGPALGIDGFARDWARYALNAQVMLIRTPKRFVPILRPFSFKKWIGNGHELGHPTEDDFAYHLTTLFPPVRPKGWLEIRVIDSLPAPWWRVAVAFTCLLLQDPIVADKTASAIEETKDLWTEAASTGLHHPALARAADTCFFAAMEAMPTSAVDITTASAMTDYYDRFVARRRTPADEQIDSMTQKVAE